MTTPNNQNQEKSDMRAMLILSVVIVLIIGGGLGLNMLFHQDSSSVEMSSQSRPAQN